jgi:hypothetical protein
MFISGRIEYSAIPFISLFKFLSGVQIVGNQEWDVEKEFAEVDTIGPIKIQMWLRCQKGVGSINGWNEFAIPGKVNKEKAQRLDSMRLIAARLEKLQRGVSKAKEIGNL